MTDAMTDAEVRRIDSTTRAPEMLAEIKAALNNDPGRFARTVARPMIVDRLLRERFEQDASLHVAGREQLAQVRDRLLDARKSGADASRLLGLLRDGHSNEVVESGWLLTVRPTTQAADESAQAQVQERFGPGARLLSTANDPMQERKLYIEDMPAELRHVLLAQLAKAGDVSAVIEVEGGFLLYLAKDRTQTRLDLACMALPKQDFDGWVREQCAKLKQ